MCKFFLTLVLGFACVSVQAEWTKVNEYAKSTVYVNLDKIQRDDNLVKMWTMSDYKSPQHTSHKKLFRSIKSQAEYDCNASTRRIVSTTHYSGRKGKGEVVYSNAYFDKPWLPVVNNDLESLELAFACKS